MVSVRPSHPDAPGSHGRLNLLLTCAGWRDEPWPDQLPRLLEPLGVRVIRANSGREATAIIRANPVHVAVVDLSLPLDAAIGGMDPAAALNPTDSRPPEEGGPRLLELLSRLNCPPPTVVVRRRRTRREDARGLTSALDAGVFAVVDRPVQLETVLEVMRRVLRRFYADRWPDGL